MKSYQQALGYLNLLLGEKYPHPTKFKFERIKKALEHLGNPQNKFRSIHVGGTAGKGSTATMIASILKESGYKIGLYTSPYLEDLRERFQINGKYISERNFVYTIGEVKKISKKINDNTKFGYLSYLETLALIAFQYFSSQKVDFAIIEVGLGRILDIVDNQIPEVSVITNVGLDHTKVWGNSIEKISRRKSKIIKPNTVLITASREPTFSIFKKQVQKFNSQLIRINFKKLRVLKISRLGTLFSYKSYQNLRLGLVGEFQAENAALAIETTEVLRRNKWKISENSIKIGLRKAFLPARFEIISPKIILDISANSLEFSRFVETYQKISGGKKCLIICGIDPNLSIPEMVKIISRICYTVLITKFYPKSASEKLSEVFREFKKNKITAKIIKNPKIALKIAKKELSKGEFLVITGSPFLAGYLRKYLTA